MQQVQLFVEYLRGLYNEWRDSPSSAPKKVKDFVIFSNNGNYIFISYCSPATFSIYLVATSFSIVMDYQKYVQSRFNRGYIQDKELTIYTQLSDGSTECSPLNQLKTMDLYVSKHKPKIITMLNNFKSMVPLLGGYGSRNLGIMLYGEPGTGKTLLMKAVANYLGRHIRIIDMRKIKTCDHFRKLFISKLSDSDNYKKLVYVLDEFDCIKGVVRNRALVADTEIANSNAIKYLKEKRLQMLQVPTNDTNKDNIKLEIDKINAEITDLENVLTLDTMLTVLDGVVEHSERVIIAATNHIDEIDPALMRDGRFDIKIKLEKFDADETRELLNVMFKDASAKQIKRLNNTTLVSNVYTPAQLINMAMEYHDLGKLLDILDTHKKKM
jgi:AAA+ superfamily predicted ATPase